MPCVYKHCVNKASKGLARTAGLAAWTWRSRAERRRALDPTASSGGCLSALGPGSVHTRRVAGLGLAAASRLLCAGLSGPALDSANPICSPQELSPGHQNPLLMSCGGQTPTGETPEPLCPSRPLSCQEWLACATAKGGQDGQGAGHACQAPGTTPAPVMTWCPCQWNQTLGPAEGGPPDWMEVAGVRILAQRGPR